MNARRNTKFKSVAQKRQPNLTVLLENVHDQHNIGAVLRTCDSVGVMEIFVLQTIPEWQTKNITVGKRTSKGTRKWVDVHYYTEPDQCFQHVRSKYDFILSTHLTEDSRSLYELDLTASIALLFGNEHTGLTKEALAYSDGNFTIPQVGMTESLNISVACAVTLYEAFRQRQQKECYDENVPLSPKEQSQLYASFLERHKAKANRQYFERLDG